MASDEIEKLKIGGNIASSGVNAGLSIVGSLIRNGQLKKARQMIRDLDIPSAEKFMYEAAMMEDPQKFAAQLQNRTEMEGITEDPRLRQAQMMSLQGLQDIQAGGGYTTTERGQVEQTMQDALTRQRGAEMAQLQRAQSRGMGGSGLQMASDLARQQGGITAAANAGFNIAQGGQQRALQAMQAGGQLGGQIRGQEFGQNARKATAQDMINRANVGAQNQGQQFNIQNKMRTDQYNADAATKTAQATADANYKKTLLDIDKAKMEIGTYGA